MTWRSKAQTLPQSPVPSPEAVEANQTKVRLMAGRLPFMFLLATLPGETHKLMRGTVFW